GADRADHDQPVGRVDCCGADRVDVTSERKVKRAEMAERQIKLAPRRRSGNEHPVRNGTGEEISTVALLRDRAEIFSAEEVVELQFGVAENNAAIAKTGIDLAGAEQRSLLKRLHVRCAHKR